MRSRSSRAPQEHDEPVADVVESGPIADRQADVEHAGEDQGDHDVDRQRHQDERHHPAHAGQIEVGRQEEGRQKVKPDALEQGAQLICLAGDTGTDAGSLQGLLRDDALVAAATPEGGAMLVSKDGVLLTQRPLHVAGGADTVAVVDTDFGRLAVLPGSDLIFPEAVRLAALQSVSTLLVPASLVEDWEGRTGAVERAAENRVNIILASARPGERGSLIASLQKIWSQPQSRPG